MNKKFRVWDNHIKKFLDSYKNQGLLFQRVGGAVSLTDALQDTNFVVQQYIGVDDKNKNPIYEGDIVNFQYRDEGLYHGVVDFDDMYAGYSVQKSLAFFGNMQITFHNSAELTVIGNIFENPKLLK